MTVKESNAVVAGETYVCIDNVNNKCETIGVVPVTFFGAFQVSSLS